MGTQRYLTSTQAAEILGCHDRTVRRWINEDKIAYVRRNNQRLIPLSEVERMRETMPDMPPPLSERVAILEEKVAEYERQKQKQDQIIQALMLKVEQLLNVGGSQRRQGQPRSSAKGAEKRGYPAGTLSLVEFARRHGLKEQVSALKDLHKSKEIQLAVYIRQGEPIRNKLEWWILPEQQQAVIRYCLEHDIPCQSGKDSDNKQLSA